MRLLMNLMVLVGLYIGGSWVWQNILPSGMRSVLSSAAHEAYSNISASVH